MRDDEEKTLDLLAMKLLSTEEGRRRLAESMVRQNCLKPRRIPERLRWVRERYGQRYMEWAALVFDAAAAGSAPTGR